MKKSTLWFYTNMPTPYQLDFLDSLSKIFNLNVVYFSNREADRDWNLEHKSDHYNVYLLESPYLVRLIQKKIPSFHFSLKIISLIWNISGDFHLVNGTYWSPNTLAILVLNKLKGRITAYWSEAILPSKSSMKRTLKRLFLLPVRICSTFLLAIGSRAKHSFIGYGYKKPIYELPYNINVAAFDKNLLDSKRRAKLLEEYKTNGEIIFITSCSLIYRKGVDVLIKAFRKIKAPFPLRLFIVGDGPDRGPLENLARSDQRISFIGFLEKGDIPYWFSIADCFVLASRYDGWGLVVNEAVAAGLTVIASDSVGAAVDSATKSKAIILSENENVDSFCTKMSSFCLDRSFRPDSDPEYQELRQYLSSDYNAEKLSDIFRNCK